MLTEEIILSKNPKYIDISSIKKLDISLSNISNITILSRMKNLEILSIFSNKISSLYPLSKCENLREINLEYNNIISIEELYFLQNLKKLKILLLKGNPICHVDNYTKLVIKILPNLLKLDNINVIEYKNKNRNQKFKYMKKELTEDKKVTLDYEESNSLLKVSYNKKKYDIKKIFMKRIYSYFDSPKKNKNKENSNNLSRNINDNHYLKFLKQNKGMSEHKKQINFRNIKLKLKKNKRNIYNNILLSNYLKRCPQIPYYRKQIVDIYSNNTDKSSDKKQNRKNINKTIQNSVFHQNTSELKESTTININHLFKVKNDKNIKIKEDLKNLKYYKNSEINYTTDNNNYVKAISLLINKMNIQDLKLLEKVINKKIEILTK